MPIIAMYDNSMNQSRFSWKFPADIVWRADAGVSWLYFQPFAPLPQLSGWTAGKSLKRESGLFTVIDW